MKKTIHIGFICDTFLIDWSGIERLFASLAAELIDRGHRVSILAQTPPGPVSPKIPLTPLPEGCGLLKLDWESEDGRDEAKIQIAQAEFDVLIAPCAGGNFLKVPQLLSGSGIPLVAAESVHPRVLTYERWNPYEHYGALSLCDGVQILLEEYRSFYPTALHSRITSIGNPAPAPQKVDWERKAQKSKRTLLSVGRFDEVDKQYTLLLRTWQLLAPEFPDWTLTLVGDGRDFALYSAMADALGDKAPVTITGSVADPSPYYEDADIFCMPSRQEGFPLVLGEAASWGLPLVGLDSCDAAHALIAPGCGSLAENSSPAALAEALRPLMAAEPEERQRTGQSAQTYFAERYTMTKMVDKWEELLLKLATHRGDTRQDRLQLEQWDESLLGQVGRELLSRSSQQTSAVHDSSFAAAMARMQSNYDALAKDYKSLLRRYDALARQSQGKRKR